MRGAGELWPPVWNRDSTLVAVGYRGGVPSTASIPVARTSGCTRRYRRERAWPSVRPTPTCSSSNLSSGHRSSSTWRRGRPPQLTLPEGLNCCFGVAFHPDGTMIAVSAGASGVAVLDTRSGQLVRTLPIPSNFPFYAAFNARRLPARGGRREWERRAVEHRGRRRRLVRDRGGWRPRPDSFPRQVPPRRSTRGVRRRRARGDRSPRRARPRSPCVQRPSVIAPCSTSPSWRERGARGPHRRARR